MTRLGRKGDAEVINVTELKSDEIMCEDSVILSRAHGNAPRLHIRGPKLTMTATQVPQPGPEWEDAGRARSNAIQAVMTTQ